MSDSCSKASRPGMPSFLSRGNENCAIYVHAVVENDLDAGGYLFEHVDGDVITPAM